MKYRTRYLESQLKKKKDWRFIRHGLLIALLGFGILFCWLWYDGIFSFPADRSQQQAYITEVNLVPVRGMWYSVNYLQGVHYTYSFNGETYSGIEQIGKKLGRLYSGDSIDIEVLMRKPEVSRITYP